MPETTDPTPVSFAAVPVAFAPAIGALTDLDPIFRVCRETHRAAAWELRPDGFSGLVHIILEQQVSTASGIAAHRKLAARLGAVTPAAFLDLSEEDLRACGFSRQKAGYCRALAEAVLAGRFDPDALGALPDEAATAALVSLKGVGRWTADIYLLLSLGRPDVWPVGDLALQVGLQRLLGLAERPAPERMAELGEPWRPYRSTAARLIWSHYLAVADQRRRKSAARVTTRVPSVP